MSSHAHPEADKFIEQAQRLRAKNASEHEIICAADVLYPDGTKHRSKRSRLIRACRSSDESFARAEKVYHGGAIAVLDTSSAAGAPKQNINARGKKAGLLAAASEWNVARDDAS